MNTSAGFFRGMTKSRGGAENLHDVLHSVHHHSDMMNKWMEGRELKMTYEEQRVESRDNAC